MAVLFLIFLDQICPKWIKLDQTWSNCISHQSKNVTVKSCHIYRKDKNDFFVFDFFGSDLSKMDQTWLNLVKNRQKSAYVIYERSQMWQLFIVTFLDWWEIHFDQVWSILDRSNPKKIKNKTAIFIVSVNVTNLYRNIFRLVRKSIWSSLVKFDPFWTDLIQKNQK